MSKQPLYELLRTKADSALADAPFGPASVKDSASHQVAGAIDRAARLMGEASHDIKSPVSAIRELLRSMGDGDLGSISEFQQSALADGVEQCDAVISLIENMLHLDRLRSGLPAVWRRWITPSSIAASADGVLQSIARVRRVRVNWNGFDGSCGPIYGDPTLLRRLLINLVGNAVAVSPEEGMVMVSLRPSLAPGMMRLVVADSGPGMSFEKIHEMALRGTSETGGMGLGLAIGRALSALHFGRLLVMSQPGSGTRIALELPAGGPASVARALSRWRETVCRPHNETSRRIRLHSPREAEKEIRIDLPQGSPKATRHRDPEDVVELPFDGIPPRYPTGIVAVGLRIDPKTQNSRADAIDQIVQCDQRLHELVYRTDVRRWVFVWDNNLDEAARRCASLDRRIREAGDVGDLAWSQPVQQTIGKRSDQALIGEILVRDTLHASSRAPRMDDRQGRTMQPVFSNRDDVSSRRLDEELRRLNPLMRRQSTRMQEQARRLAAAMGDGT